MAFRAPLSAARSSRNVAGMETGSIHSMQAWRRRSLLFVGALTLAVLPACTIEVGPPPESDPPLVSEAEKVEQEPPPVQPTEPQAWSRDLDFDGGEARVREGELADGLVAAEQGRAYSGERLTFKSADISEKPPTEAELALERARQRMLEAQSASSASAAAPTSSPPPAPPEVVAAPVEEVSAAALPDQSAAPSDADSESAPSQAAEAARADPPPSEAVQMASAEEPTDNGAGSTEDSETVAADGGEEAMPEATVELSSETSAQPEAATAVVPSDPANESATTVQTAALPATEEAVQEAAPDPASKLPPDKDAPGRVDSPDVAFWDAPVGTILVQMSVIQDRSDVAGEWERLKEGYPGVLGALRPVVEEAKLGDRSAFFRVQAGGFDSQALAEAACVTLMDQGQSCLVVERAKQDSVFEPIQTAAQPEVEAPEVPAAATSEDAAAVQTVAAPATEEPIQEASLEPATKLLADNVRSEQSDGSDAAFWDPPAGTILVQVSAIQDESEIPGEWERLKKSYPGVLGPLRLVVEEAKLGERGVFFRVQAGGFDSEEQAQTACESLTEQGQQCFVLERTKGG